MTQQTLNSTVLAQAELPAKAGWDALIALAPHPDDAHEPTPLLSWRSALYHGGPDFQELIEHGVSPLHYAILDDGQLVAYRFHNPRINSDHQLMADGELHPAWTDPRNQYHADVGTAIRTVSLIIRPTDPRTAQAIREFLLA